MWGCPGAAVRLGRHCPVPLPRRPCRGSVLSALTPAASVKSPFHVELTCHLTPSSGPRSTNLDCLRAPPAPQQTPIDLCEILPLPKLLSDPRKGRRSSPSTRVPPKFLPQDFYVGSSSGSIPPTAQTVTFPKQASRGCPGSLLLCLPGPGKAVPTGCKIQQRYRSCGLLTVSLGTL